MRLGPTKPEDLQWMTDRTGMSFTGQAKGIKAVDSNDVIRGMAVYDNWKPNSCVMHQAADYPIVWRSLLPDIFVYPFQTVGVLIGFIAGDHRRSLTNAMDAGFEITYRIKEGYSRGVDLVVLEMARENCRYLKPGWHLTRRQSRVAP